MTTSFIGRVLRKLFNVAEPFKRNRLDEIDVLIHKAARHHAAHGFVVASNRALNIKKGEVAVVFPDLEDVPPLTHLVMTDLWEALHAQGWVPHYIAAWGTIRALAQDEQPEAGEEQDQGFRTAGFTSAAIAEARLAADVSDVPAYLRNRTGAPQEFGRAAPSDASGTVKFARRKVLDPVYAPEVQLALDDVKAKVAHLEPTAREAAYVRFISVVDNSIATHQHPEHIRAKLNHAVDTILSVHLHAEPMPESQAH